MLLSVISSSVISTSVISSSAVSSNAISSSVISSNTITMITSPGLSQYGAVVVVGLIALLSLKEVLSASDQWNKHLNESFNTAIIPLIFSFTGIVISKVMTII